MATRRDIQTALDLIKMSNVINDLIDCIGWYLQDIDPNSGNQLMIRDSEQAETYHEATADEIKNMVSITLSRIIAYWNTIKVRLDRADQSAVVQALSALGIVPQELRDDVIAMRDAVIQVQSNYQSAADKAALEVIGAELAAAVSNLDLVRRDWRG